MDCTLYYNAVSSKHFYPLENMARYEEDKDEDCGEPLIAPPDFDGPTAKRHFTDVLCTLLLWIMWISMTGLGIYAIQNGDYRLILYPLDYAGNGA